MDDTEKAVLIAILAVIAGLVMYFELRFMRSKGFGKRLVENAAKKDRAFNALLTTKAVRNKLRSQNYNTMKADYIIQKAQEANESGDYDSCIDACARAREELMRCKQEGEMALASSGPTDEAMGTIVEDESGPGHERKLKIPPRPKEDPSLPARFELRTAKDDLASFAGPVETRDAARALIDQAEKHLEAKDYAKALSCSYKAKKLLSGEPVKDVRPGPVANVQPSSSTTKEPAEPSGQAEPSKLKCPNCGYEIDPGDVFCGQCGNPVGERKCSSCGAKLKPSDKFCRKCGMKL
jgi:hypothetical protein